VFLLPSFFWREATRGEQKRPSWKGQDGRANQAADDRERYAAFFRGILAPFRLASDNPMAIACLRFFTRFPLLPLVSVPFFRLCIVRFTDF
jgi:hypothetical protein